MNDAAPLVSICLPTFNREDLLDLCLERLAELNRVDLDYEVIVSDNCSTDRTPEVVRERGSALRRVAYHRMTANRGPLLNWQNALRHARGEFIIYLGDDDRLIPEALAAHCETMRHRDELVATYADWISFDDNSETELHRYYAFLPERREFAPPQRLQLLDFILGNPVLPETGILRRRAMLRALPIAKTGYPYLQYLYQMSRQGTIAFDPTPFYIENRFVKAHLDRSNWQGMGLWLVNDEMRTTLEMVVLKAFQDGGHGTVPPDLKAKYREMIDERLLRRMRLEAKLACGVGNFILASELHRRWTLWRGHDTPLDLQHEIDRVVVPAALQAIQETFQSASDCTHVAFHGFRTASIPDAFRRSYPTVPVAEAAADTAAALRAGDRRLLHVLKTRADLGDAPLEGNVVFFDNLLDLYSTTAFDLVLQDL